jgi:hypothetical protein
VCPRVLALRFAPRSPVQAGSPHHNPDHVQTDLAHSAPVRYAGATMNTLLLALALANPPAAAPAPLASPAPVAAKGDAKGGPPLAHTFALTHTGAAGPVTITKIETGCGCVNQAISAHTLNPGETAKLTLEVNTLTQPDGPNRWQVQVHYRHDPPGIPNGPPPVPVAGIVPLTITASLSREVSVNPPQVAFSCAGEASQVLTITDRRGKPLTVTKTHGTAASLTAEIAPRKDGTQTVTLKLAADAPVGHRDETMVLYTDDPAYPELRVPVRVLKRAAGGVNATPSELSVRFATGQDEASGLVQLRSADGKPVRVEKAECDAPGVALKWSPGASPVAALRVTVAAAQAGSARVKVTFAEPAGHEVIVPVSWTVPQKK